MKLTPTTLNKVYKAKKCSIETMELKGYELIEEIFTDMSGFGQDDELALSLNQFDKRVKELVTEHGSLTAKITNVGQFQCYIGLFKKTSENNVKRIANNTLEVKYSDRKAIRLHDTDVVTFKGDKIILDTGGWETRTTSDRMNAHTPNGMRIYRKNWAMLVDYKGKTHEFEDNKVTITI